MKSKVSAEKLIEDLLEDPETFEGKERAYDLLQAYLNGYPLNTLRPLLGSANRLVQHAAAYVVSELGRYGSDLVDDVTPLLDTDDRYLRYHAMEILTVCCDGERADGFVPVIRMLGDDDQELRNLAMRLMSNADESQLQAGARFFSGGPQSDGQHERGLSALLKGEAIKPEEVRGMLADTDALNRRYGAIAAMRLRKSHPELFARVLASSDAEVRNFGERMKSIYRIE
jgi:hypothetical protein